MNLGPLIGLIIVIVIISAVVGAIAQFLNKLSEMNAPPARRPGAPPPRPEGGGTVRQSNTDMDRFLAEIERLRKRNAAEPSRPPGEPATARPSAKPPQPDRPRSRVVAELAEAPPSRPTEPPSAYTSSPTGLGGAYATSAPTAPPAAQLQDLPVAMVVAPSSATGAPATRVTRLPQRARPAAKTNLAFNLTGLLNSGQGVAMAVILQEVLGPPKSKKQ